jgi:hypothetical protein
MFSSWKQSCDLVDAQVTYVDFLWTRKLFVFLFTSILSFFYYRKLLSLWNPRPVKTPVPPRRKSFSPVLHGVDKEKANQEFFHVS